MDLSTGDVVRRAVRAVRRTPRRAARAGAQLGRDRAPPTRRRSAGSSCRSPGSPATSSRRCSGRPASTPATPSAPTAPARSSSPTPARSLERSDAGLLSTAAWRSPDGELTYALEGAIFVTGAAVQWLRDGLQIVGSAAETEAIAATVESSEGVVFVPALTGLGAPHWDPHARGTILGITRGTTRAHLVRATLEAIAFEVRDVLATMPGAGLVTAARRRRRVAPTTCSAGSRPTSSASRSSGRGSSRPPASARRSWPGSASGSGTPPTTCARPGSSTAASSPTGATARAADAAYARWQDAVRPLAWRWADDCSPQPELRSRAPSGRRRGSVTAAAWAASASALGLLGLGQLLVGLLGLRLQLGELAAELVDLRLELEAAGLELLGRLAVACAAPLGLVDRLLAPRPAPPRPPRAPRAASSSPVRRAARAARAPRAAVGVAANPSASGSATAAATSTASTPVDDSAAVSSPLRTARAHSGSTIAAVSVASTWSATAWVTFTPSSSASARACWVTAEVSCRRCLVSARSSAPSIPSWASRRAGPDRDHLLDLRGLAAYEQVDDPGRHRRLLQLLDRGREVLVGLELLGLRVPRGRELLQRQRVELVGDLEQVGRSVIGRTPSPTGYGGHSAVCSRPVGVQPRCS